jgi:hypothetical protein
MERISLLTSAPTPFLDGPAEFLCKSVAEQLTAVRQWKAVFGEFIDGYKRMDYGIRNLPALRVYNNTASVSSQNGWLTGELIADAILPASLRRNELQQVQDTLSAALWQQFRRNEFFHTMRALVPALNELGRVVSVDKSLGYKWEEADDEVVPLTQFTINFKLDLRIWDDYLTEQCRTTDDPFERTLRNLELISNTIRGVSAETDTPAEVELGAEKSFEEE